MSKCEICKAAAALTWVAPNAPKSEVIACQKCFDTEPRTIDGLKKALKKFDVALPTNTPRKADYQKLYKIKLVTGKKSRPLARGASAKPVTTARGRAQEPKKLILTSSGEKQTTTRPLRNSRSRASRSPSRSPSPAARGSRASRSKSPRKSRTTTTKAASSSSRSRSRGTARRSTASSVSMSPVIDLTPAHDDSGAMLLSDSDDSPRPARRSTSRSRSRSRPRKSPVTPVRTPTRKASPSSSTSTDGSVSKGSSLPYGLIVLIAVLLGVTIAAVKQRKPALPYCNSAIDPATGESQALASQDFTKCAPCAEHGTCTGGVLKCDRDFVEKHGLCVEDQEITLATHDVVDHARYILSLRKGLVVCGEIEGSQTAVLSQDDLRRALLLTREHQSLEERFPTVFNKAILILQQNANAWNLTITAASSKSSKRAELHFESEVAIKSVKCQLRDWVYANPLYIACFGSVIMLILYIWSQRRAATLTEFLAVQVRKRLREQPGHPIATTHLRDDLREEFGSYVTSYWPKVEALIDHDSRIEVNQSTNAAGGPVIVWYWTSSTPGPHTPHTPGAHTPRHFTPRTTPRKHLYPKL